MSLGKRLITTHIYQRRNAMVVLATFGFLIVSAFLLLIIILILSNLGAYFTKIPQGTTVFISAGESLKAILPNVGGYEMSSCEDLDGRKWLIPRKYMSGKHRDMFYKSIFGTRLFQRWLWKAFGIKFISWFWPHTNVHRFDIRKGGRRRLVAPSELAADAPLRSRVRDSEEPTEVDSLLFLTPRPVYVEGIELAGDSSRVNLLLLPVFRQVIPALPAYYLKGDFYTPLDAAIEAAMVDFFATHRVAVRKNGDNYEFAADYPDPENKDLSERPMTYGDWIKLDKGETSPLEKWLRNLNVSPSYLERLRSEKKDELVNYIENELVPGDHSKTPSSEKISGMIPNGIVPRFGFAMVSFRLVGWEAHPTTQEYADAFLASEKAIQLARGARETAAGERDAQIAVAKGEKERGSMFVQALIELGVTPDVAASIFETQVRTGNIRDSNITTYVEGGGSKQNRTSLVIPVAGVPKPRNKE